MLPHVEASLLLIYAVCENFKIQNHGRIMYCIKGMWSQVLINTLQGQYPWSMLNQHSSNTSVDTQDQHSIDILVDSQLSFDRCIWASRHSADYWLTACWSSADWVLTEYQSGFRMRCWWGWGGGVLTEYQSGCRMRCWRGWGGGCWSRLLIDTPYGHL